MGKRIMRVMLAVLLAFGWMPAAAYAATDLNLAAPSSMLMDVATGTVLYEANAHEELAPASVTKVMTLLLVMEALDSGKIAWTDNVTASEAAAAKGGSQVYLKVGETMTVEEMVKCTVVCSANDCACALAELIAGSEAAFVDLMNQRAAQLGMEHTHFVNCTGLDDSPEAAQHLTCAYDIALMSCALLKHEAVKQYTTIWMDTIRNGTFGLSNTNKLVRFYEGTTGLKTGSTGKAGYCLSASAKRDGMELVAVVMHCATSSDRFQSAKALLDYGFANYAVADPNPAQGLGNVPVLLGAEESVPVELQNASPILVEKAQRANIVTQVKLDEAVTAPVTKGQTVGAVTMKVGDQILSSIPVVSSRDIPRLTMWQLVWESLRAICMGKPVRQLTQSTPSAPETTDSAAPTDATAPDSTTSSQPAAAAPTESVPLSTTAPSMATVPNNPS